MEYSDYQRNHAIIPGREKALEDFLKQDYKGMRHKWKNRFSSHSEDALTWTCFEMLKHFPLAKKISVLDEILEDAYQGKCNFKFADNSYAENQVQIFIGKQYTGLSTNESTEVDASIELPDKLFFIEAKLYSSISLADKTKNKPYDQIAKKIRVGLDSAGSKEFYFIFLDIAPISKLTQRKTKTEALSTSKGGFYDKWKSAWWFSYYKDGRNKSLKPLCDILNGIPFKTVQVQSVANNMGWLTWSDLYKSILRGILTDKNIFNGH